jgi:hypothetical protein
MSPLRDIIRDQGRINDEVCKKIHATDKLLENINAKMDSFTVAIPSQSNGGSSSLCSRKRL